MVQGVGCGVAPRGLGLGVKGLGFRVRLRYVGWLGLKLRKFI